MKKVLIIDNFDSFTYNLVQLVEEVSGNRPDVIRNDVLSTKLYAVYDSFILSPGPGLPQEAGGLLEFIEGLPEKKQLLGVCLGHQAIAEVFGGNVYQLDKVYHGLVSTIRQVKKDDLFERIPISFEVGRYHSWCVQSDLPECLEVVSVDGNQQIMALRHVSRPIKGVQFHPESILTPMGRQIISNFLSI